jgi:hypothetical protein
MRTKLGASILSLGVVAATTADAGDRVWVNDPNLQPDRPAIVSTIPFHGLACMMMSAYPNGWSINVWNISAGWTVPQGTQIQWNALNGLSGFVTVGSGGLAPGDGLGVGMSDTPWSCFAQAVL